MYLAVATEVRAPVLQESAFGALLVNVLCLVRRMLLQIVRVLLRSAIKTRLLRD